MPHIPSIETTKLSIMPFEEALTAAKLARHDYDVTRWLYVPPVYGEYRYILGTIGKNPLICVGINPSTAAPDALDNTLKSVERIAHFNGHDSFLMFNLYAQRATDPDDMEKTCNERLHKENLKAFAYALSLSQTRPAVWAAWGAVIEKRPYLLRIAADFAAVADRCAALWYRCGALSKKGHPHHPLYLRADSVKIPFDLRQYLASVSR